MLAKTVSLAILLSNLKDDSMFWFFVGAGVLFIFLAYNSGKTGTPIHDKKNWTISQNGNETMVRNGLRVTVFSRDRSWAYAFASEDGEEAHFSDDFETQSQAKRAALHDLFGIGSEIISRQRTQEIKREKLHTSKDYKKTKLGELTALKQDLSTLEGRVAKCIAKTTGTPRTKTLKKDLQTKRNKAKFIMLEAIDADMTGQEKDAYVIFNKLCDLLDKLEAYEEASHKKPNT